MIVGYEDRIVHHSVSESFGHLLRCAMHGTPCYAALGPIYNLDPASEILAPFYRSAREIEVDPDVMEMAKLAPPHIIEKVNIIRRNAVIDRVPWTAWKDVEDWTRAGLVLEVASRRGIHFREGTKAHVRWKMSGTVTGRFGIEQGSFNPLVIPKDKRDRIIPSHPAREISVMDFRAMDLCSIVSLFPTLADRYKGCDDLHARTADLVGIDREVAKRELFVFAYGGHSAHEREFSRSLPELVSEKGPDLARKVQERSATAFKAGLSRALPLLVGDDVRPMFTVHDELVLDCLSERPDLVAGVAKALEEGASERIGVTYKVGVKMGPNYGEAKS